MTIILIVVFQILGKKYNYQIKYFFNSLIYGIASTIPLTIIYLPIRIGLEKFYKERISFVDIKNDNYYRDIIQKYSPAVLDYIDDFEIGINTLIAILMGLKLKGIINDDFKIIKNDFSKLDENEKYVCNHINELQDIDIENLKYVIREDGKKYELLEVKKRPKNYKKIAILNWLVPFTIVAFIITFIIMMTNVSDIIKIIVMAILPFLGSFIFIIYLIYGITYSAATSKEPCVRTKKGEQVNEKLEGLKKYLEDFSSLENKSEEELILWEDYLIYSVIFNQNEKIIKEYREKIEKR